MFSPRAYGAFRLDDNASFRLCPFPFYCTWNREETKCIYLWTACLGSSESI